MRTHVCLAAVLICCLAPVRALELDESSYDSAVSGRVKQHYATGVESYDPFLGKLTMRHVDLVLPGNGGLDLVLQRVFDNGELKLFSREPPEALGNGWRMHMGRLLVEEPSVCNPRYGTKVAYLAPDGSRQSFYRADRDALWISKSFWAIRCSERVPRMISPAGVTYEFGYNKDQYTYHLTRIVDRNGNWLLVDYHGFPADIEQRLIDTITSSDGRAVTFRYDALNTETGGGDNSGLVHTSRLTGIEIGDTGIAISYGYSGNPYHAAVTRVTLANGQTWHFRYHRLYEFPASVTLHRFAGYIDSSVSPSGRSAQYRYHANAQAYDVDVIVEGAGEWRHRSERGTWSVTATVQSPYYCERREYSRDRDDVWLWGSLRAEWLYDTRDCSGDPAQSITHEYDWLYVSADTDTITAAPGTTYGHGDTYAAVPAKRRTFRDATEYVTQRGDYDTYGNPGWIREWSPNGELRETRFTYFTDVGPWHVNGLPLTEVVSGIAGGIDRSYDASGNLVSETVYGTRTGFEYTTDGDVSAVIDALGRRHSYGDYHRGVPRAESLANGASIARAVDDFGYVTSTTLADTYGSYTTRTTFDALGRLTSVDLPRADDHPISIDYTLNATGIEKIVRRGDLIHVQQHDSRGNLLTDTRDGITTFLAYDALDRTVSRSNPGDAETVVRYYYDGVLGRRVRVVDQQGYETRFAHLPGDRVESTDPAGYVTVQEYRSFGVPENRELMRVSAPENQVTVFERDVLGAITRITQNDLAHTFHYDAARHLAWEERPEFGRTVYGRDALGNMTSRTVAGSPATRFEYDAAGRLTLIDYPVGTADVAYGYDGRDLLRSLSNADAQWRYDYDANGNLTRESVTLSDPALTFAFAYEYDAGDHRSAMTYPSGRRVTYQPNLRGQPQSAGPYVVDAAYNPDGTLDRFSYANGVSVLYAYDAMLRVTSIAAAGTGGTVFQHQYAFDGNGNFSEILDLFGNTGKVLGYDGLNRLVSAQGPWGTGSITFDADGDLIVKVIGEASINFGYDARNRLSTTSGARVGNYSYDDYGNVVADGSSTFAYDAAGNLTRIERAGYSEDYAYDGHKRRVRKSVAGVGTEHFVYGQAGNLLLKSDGTGSRVTEFVYFAGRQVARVSDGATDYFHSDVLGSVVATTDQAGEVASYQDYHPYGSLYTGTGTIAEAALLKSHLSCPADWSFLDTMCSLDGTVAAASVHSETTCPPGWTLTGTYCHRTLVETTAAAEQFHYECDATATLIGDRCQRETGDNGETWTYDAARVVDGYTCDAGWTIAGTQCRREISYQQAAVSSVSFSCPDGWSRACAQGVTNTQPAAANPNYSCPVGYSLSGTQCTLSTTYTSSATPVYRYDCPDQWNVTKIYRNGRWQCRAEYGDNGNAYYYDAAPSVDYYTCPTGYTLSGTTCYRTATDTRSAYTYYTYSCDSGWTLQGTNCYRDATNYRAASEDLLYTCPNGWIAVGDQCMEADRTATGYTGHQHDIGTGLVYMQARYFDPVLGRFLANDPVGFVEDNFASFNRYAYANGNPYKYVDPTGGESIDVGITPDRDDPDRFYGPLGEGELSIEAGLDDIEAFLHAVDMASNVLPGKAVLGAIGISVRMLGAAARKVHRLRFERVVSKPELEATLETGMLRGGRPGTNYFSNHVSLDAKRAQQRLALEGDLRDYRIQFSLIDDIPISGPRPVAPLRSGVPGGGLEYATHRTTRIEILRVDRLRK